MLKSFLLFAAVVLLMLTSAFPSPHRTKELQKVLQTRRPRLRSCMTSIARFVMEPRGTARPTSPRIWS